jgi:N-glycosidase YbiA
MIQKSSPINLLSLNNSVFLKNPQNKIEYIEINTKKRAMEIKFFQNNSPYYFLSNYYSSPIVIDGVKWLSVEHYFQAQKFNQPESIEYYNLLLNADSPQKAKNLGTQKPNDRGSNWYINKNKRELGLMNDQIMKYKDVKMRNDWESVKDGIMEFALLAKFTQHEDLKEKLLSTNDAKLIEDSPYDSYWGSARNGKNMLGLLLMKVRDSIRS